MRFKYLKFGRKWKKLDHGLTSTIALFDSARECTQILSSLAHMPSVNSTNSTKSRLFIFTSRLPWLRLSPSSSAHLSLK